jgi:uncharacterized protein (TIGR02145 family)
VSGGNVTDNGGAEVTSRGVAWGAAHNPTTGTNETNDGTGSGAFTSYIPALTANTTYYVRAYATNSEGTAYGNEVSFVTSPIALATLTTTEVTSITSSSGNAGFSITNDGGEIIIAGVCWSTSPNPTISDNHYGFETYGLLSFPNINLYYLDPNTTYYVRAYATNSAGTAYGNQVSFTTSDGKIVFNPNLTYSSVTDVDGNVYKTIKIGTQTWMAENLKVTHYVNGNLITKITDDTQWEFLTTEAYCDYNNKPSFSTIYGKLYNWYSVVDSRNICPIGWHLPSDAEWTTLITYLGGVNVAGGKLKETGTTHWKSPNEGATNESGFTGLPGGGRSPEGIFDFFIYYGQWWSFTEDNTNNALYSSLDYGTIYAFFSSSATKNCGFSVRCVKD